MTEWTAQDMPSLDCRVAIVTGANSGLGLETASELAAHGAKVILACRNPDKTHAAMAQIKQRAPKAELEFGALDLADLDSVRAFAKSYAGAPLDLLINNAGVMALPLRRTRQGFEMQMGTNHLGHFALTALLHPALAAAKSARVVTVASLAHRWTRGIDFDDLGFEHSRYLKWDAYGKSKLANLLFTRELDRRLRASGATVKALAAHPGYSSTNLGVAGPAMSGSVASRWMMSLGDSLFAQSAAMGALPTLYAATVADLQGGEFIGSGGFRQMRGYPRRVTCSAAARNDESAARLWALSESLTGVKFLRP
jgi:NAD(P)-dependent dehydrogenase (short-subunit alcohol dehydrogenase family)